MGKPTGFMEYERRSNSAAAPLERIKNYDEFRIFNDTDERRRQAARCMNCGVPFCQSGENFGGMVSGCPLHNLIPEWNDEVYNDHYAEALSRLLKTNCFPEFTGRVCPALCEAACTCGLNGMPVTVHDNELFIIEQGFEKGLMKPKIPESRSGKRVAVVGSGPAGLAAAHQLNQRGHTVTVFEREKRPGGLLMYGIPNMKLDKGIVERRISLMEKEGVIFKTGVDVGKDVSAENLKQGFNAVILCCGSKTPRDLNVPGREADGVYFAVDYLSSVTKKLIGESESCLSAENKNVIIVGGGDTGNDCAGTAIRQGCKSLIQLEMMEKLPDERGETNPWPQWPRVCKTDYGQEEAIAVFGCDPRLYCTTVKEIIKDEAGKISAVVTVKLKPCKDGKTGRIQMKEVDGSEEKMPCDMLLIAAGFIGCESYVTDAFGLERTQRGCIVSQNGHYTSKEGIFTAGDSRRGQSLVVWAIAEGRACAAETDEFLLEIE